MKNLLLLMLLWGVAVPLTAQELEWQRLFTLDFPHIDLLDIDNRDYLYLADQEGNVTVFDQKGDSTNYFSPTFQGKLTQLETSRTTNVFTFSRDLQRIEILDRFLAPVYTSRLNSAEIGNIRAASMGNNLKVWLFDETNLHLLQWDYQRGTILQNQPLNLLIPGNDWTVAEITEYKNTLFVNLSERGIHLLDNQANYIGKLEVTISQKMAFHDHYLVSLQHDKVQVIDYLTGKSRYFDLPVAADKVAVGKNIVVFFTSTQVVAFALPEGMFR